MVEDFDHCQKVAQKFSQCPSAHHKADRMTTLIDCQYKSVGSSHSVTSLPPGPQRGDGYTPPPLYSAASAASSQASSSPSISPRMS